MIREATTISGFRLKYCQSNKSSISSGLRLHKRERQEGSESDRKGDREAGRDRQRDRKRQTVRQKKSDRENMKGQTERQEGTDK